MFNALVYHRGSTNVNTMSLTHEEAVARGFDLRFTDEHVRTIGALPVELTYSVGHYQWCGRYHCAGHYLTDRANSKPSRLAMITIHLPHSLHGIVEKVLILFKKQIRYNVHDQRADDIIRFVFELPLDEEITELKVYVGAYVKSSSDTPMFTCDPFQVFAETTCLVTEMVPFDNRCPICLDDVTSSGKDQYLSICRHLFHHSCLWSYLRTSKLVLPADCNRGCQHNIRCAPFSCPVCRTPLEDHSILTM